MEQNRQFAGIDSLKFVKISCGGERWLVGCRTRDLIELHLCRVAAWASFGGAFQPDREKQLGGLKTVSSAYKS